MSRPVVRLAPARPVVVRTLAAATLLGAAVLLAASAAGCAARPLAPRLSGLGDWRHSVTTDVPDAQAFFDQGLRLSYAFNHREATRAFQEAARLDPDCAMAYWGIALANGPNINAEMKPEGEALAREAIARAQALTGDPARRERYGEKERACVEALAVRFGEGERAALDAAYADAMADVARRHPDDADAQVLWAAAIMETTPWDYWNEDGSPKERIAGAAAALEGVLEARPEHAGAIHYYIHLVEATDDPDRAEPHADRLAALMPGAGHIVHMPSHVYVRVGRYADASDINVAAIAADEDYLSQCRVQGLYPAGYYPHNIHFLWSAASMEGRFGVAMDAAKRTAAEVKACCGGFLPVEDVHMTPLYTLVRFGRWDEVLAHPAPPVEERFATAMWHYGRGAALAARGDLRGAETELARLGAVAAEDALAELQVNYSPARDVLAIAAGILEGEIAARRGEHDVAVAALREAIAKQAGLVYMEPPTFHYPVRQSLGAVLLAAGRAADAEAVFREDLAEWRENGWSLMGLVQALRAQGKEAEADEAAARFQRAWARADTELTGAVFR
jgi:tetratricopeptide (TPR) repeat protein